MSKVFAVAAALAIAVYQLLPDNPWWTAGWQMGVGYAGAAAILIGARRLPRRERLPWWLFAAGIAADVTGIGVSVYCDNVLEWYDPPTPADPLFLLLYPFCAAGIAVLIRRREAGRARNWTAMVDATTITTGFGLLAWVDVGEARQVLERALVATPLGQSFSAGLAVWDGAETSDELIQRADTALYRAKSDGRRQISEAANRPAAAAARK